MSPLASQATLPPSLSKYYLALDNKRDSNYRLCNANRLMDMAGQFANLDPSYITETLTRQIMTSIGGGSKLLEDVMFYANLNEDNLSDVNYWQAGLSAGRLMKALLDFNINNWWRLYDLYYFGKIRLGKSDSQDFLKQHARYILLRFH